jgi:error-prone DNA polymerase
MPQLRVVASSQPAHAHAISSKQLQDVLTGVRVGRPVQKCGLRPALQCAAVPARPRSSWPRSFRANGSTETVEVARQCTFSLEELRYEYPNEIVPAGETPTSHLRELTYAGVSNRALSQLACQRK